MKQYSRPQPSLGESAAEKAFDPGPADERSGRKSGRPRHREARMRLLAAALQAEGWSVNSQYASLVAAKRLVLVTLTATETKKSLIEATIRNKSWPTGLRFTVFVTPVLCQLLGGLKSNVR